MVIKSPTKQINTTFPVGVYDKIARTAQELGGVAPSVIVRAVFLLATQNGNNIDVSAMAGMLPKARHPLNAAIEITPAMRAQLDAQIEQVAAEQIRKIRDTVYATALAELRQRAAEEEEATGGASYLGAEFDAENGDWEGEGQPAGLVGKWEKSEYTG